MNLVKWCQILHWFYIDWCRVNRNINNSVNKQERKDSDYEEKEMGGVKVMEELAIERANAIYNELENSKMFRPVSFIIILSD